MASIPKPNQARRREVEQSVELENGDRMTQEEFHRAYEQTPDGFKAELIGGIVYVPSPLKLRHSGSHIPLSAVFCAYEGYTPGTEAGDNATVLLGDEAEPQPDLFLRILPEYGGQSRTTASDYVGGAPELIAEIANSSRALDLHAKRDDYTRNGVLEYLVVCVREQQLRWFDLRANQELQPDGDGVFRVRCFPGLWINPAALFARDYHPLMATLQAGLQTPEHAAFVRQLAGQRLNASNEPRLSGSGE